MPTLQFKGKPFVQNHHLAVKYHQLVPNKKNSLSDNISLHDNLIIQGDNLKALKALLPTYGGKVKCIYIDPPYNTGKEHWVYNDNVNSPMMQEWLGKEVDVEDLTRHDKWLCMMMPRLKLLRELLAENGMIFISCDDNEIFNLKGILDEIFTEKNWVGTIVWRNVTDNNPSNIAIEHEYVICYGKNKESLDKVWKSKVSDSKDVLIQIGDKLIKKYSDPEELQSVYTDWFRDNKQFLGQLDRYKYLDKGGVYTGSQSVHNPGREGYRYDIIHPITKKPCKQPLMGYRFPEDTINQLLADKKVLFGTDETKIIELKVYAKDYEDKLSSVIKLDGRIGAYDLKDFFPEKTKVFDYPKPVQFIRQLMSYVVEENDVVLDSFAGSGTTAHAVLDLNKEDGGNRKFILVEMEDYANTITAERVRRVINGVPKSKNFKEGTGGTFSYFELGNAIEMSHILDGTNLPSYVEFARYLFYTATGEQFDESKINEKTGFIGESSNYAVYLIYKPDIEYLKTTALTLERAKALPEFKGKQRLVFAPMKYLDQHFLRDLRIDFCQLPYEVYKMEK